MLIVYRPTQLEALYSLVITWVDDCFWTGEPNTQVNSAFHPIKLGKLSTILCQLLSGK